MTTQLQDVTQMSLYETGDSRGKRWDARSTCGRHGASPLLIPQRTGCLLLLRLSSLFSPGVARHRFTFNPSNTSRCPGLHQLQLSPISLNTWRLLVAHQNHRNTPECVCVCVKTGKDEKRWTPHCIKWKHSHTRCVNAYYSNLFIIKADLHTHYGSHDSLSWCDFVMMVAGVWQLQLQPSDFCAAVVA